MSYLFEIIRDDEVVAESRFDSLEEGSTSPEFKDYFEADPNNFDDEPVFEIDDCITDMVKYGYDTSTFHGKFGYLLKITEQF